MKICVLIPCYNHPATVAAVALAAQQYFPVLMVDDGSTLPLPELPGCEILRLPINAGKGAALRAGFQFAAAKGFTHAITMDADGQHFAEDLPKFLAAAQAQPSALVVGVRNFRAAGAPGHRQCSNAVSSFWFWAETGIRLRDTQCGFRCYPLALTEKLQVKSGRYAFELEFMVRATWVGTPVQAVPVKCTYTPNQIRQSHFRPVKDLAHITTMNIGLVAQSWLVPRSLRVKWSLGAKRSRRETFREIFSEHTNEPARLASAIGLGLFCGLAPIWGFQAVTCMALAHWLRLNKAITVVASHISLPPAVPFILFADLQIGHWLFKGKWLSLTLHDMTWARALEYFWETFTGSWLLAITVGLLGFFVAWCIGRGCRKKDEA
ncbi:MAG TPA: DUF2062 domain-containing protein [Verrucomicrobiae bacterium]|jgi:uncharacterized protein (DUF2062 family)